jgi:hypothetical protein
LQERSTLAKECALIRGVRQGIPRSSEKAARLLLAIAQLRAAISPDATALQIHSVEARHVAEVPGAWRFWMDGAFDAPKSKFEVLAAAGPFIIGG